MVTDQKHSSDPNEQEVIRYTKKLAQIFGLDEQNAEVYTALSSENRALKKQLEEYHFQYNTLERRVKRLERDVNDLDECVDRETVVDLIHEIVPSLIGKKGKGEVNLAIVDFYESSSSEFSEESDSAGTIVEIDGKEMLIPHKQRRKVRPRKVKRMVA